MSTTETTNPTSQAPFVDILDALAENGYANERGAVPLFRRCEPVVGQEGVQYMTATYEVRDLRAFLPEHQRLMQMCEEAEAASTNNEVLPWSLRDYYPGVDPYRVWELVAACVEAQRFDLINKFMSCSQAVFKSFGQDADVIAWLETFEPEENHVDDYHVVTITYAVTDKAQFMAEKERLLNHLGADNSAGQAGWFVYRVMDTDVLKKDELLSHLYMEDDYNGLRDLVKKGMIAPLESYGSISH